MVKFKRTTLRWRTFVTILSIGAAGTIVSLLINLTASVNNSLVSSLAGAGAVAGYGTAARLEFLMIPLAFGLGAPLVAMVGTNIGAGNRQRALKIVLIGGAVAFGVTETIGVLAALFPESWFRLFTQDATAIKVGSDYLRIVGPAFGFFGLGIGMYFALLGANLLLWPIVGAVLRSALAMCGGAIAALYFGSLHAMFIVLALALVRLGNDSAAECAEEELGVATCVGLSPHPEERRAATRLEGCRPGRVAEAPGASWFETHRSTSRLLPTCAFNCVDLG